MRTHAEPSIELATRRRFLAASSASLLGWTTLSRVSAAPMPGGPGPLPEPLPDLSDARVLRRVAGIRPYREGSFRLEAERLAGKPWVHNYGHGGAGVTLSWGCAEAAIELLSKAVPPRSRILVLGGGVMGISAAITARERGFGVRLWARELSPRTTSDLAGAQWAPSLVALGSGTDARARLERILRTSHRRFGSLLGERWGVFERPNYGTPGAASGLRRLPEGLFPPRRELERLPFEGVTRRGFVQRTFLIEPPTYMPRLTKIARLLGVRIEEREVASPSDLAEVPEVGVVNCLGLGAGALLGDRRVTPVRGQLVHLEPQDLPYLLSHSGYLFPRRDAVVLGGTSEWGEADPIPQDPDCESILDRHRRFFGLPR